MKYLLSLLFLVNCSPAKPKYTYNDIVSFELDSGLSVYKNVCKGTGRIKEAVSIGLETFGNESFMYKVDGKGLESPKCPVASYWIGESSLKMGVK